MFNTPGLGLHFLLPYHPLGLLHHVLGQSDVSVQLDDELLPPREQYPILILRIQHGQHVPGRHQRRQIVLDSVVRVGQITTPHPVLASIDLGQQSGSISHVLKFRLISVRQYGDCRILRIGYLFHPNLGILDEHLGYGTVRAVGAQVDSGRFVDDRGGETSRRTMSLKEAQHHELLLEVGFVPRVGYRGGGGRDGFDGRGRGGLRERGIPGTFVGVTEKIEAVFVRHGLRCARVALRMARRSGRVGARRASRGVEPRAAIVRVASFPRGRSRLRTANTEQRTN
mmetsp:Transcript_42699/g.129712  ORF Transcript_42699/g.129712 Transcript_42699/m.129712 type:complete len:283 (+) Transcript_42699:605-1453(+)